MLILEQENNAMSDLVRERKEPIATLQSEVRSKLEVNLPTAQLAVKAEEGVITVVGIVPTQKELNRIETLAKEIRGVERVKVRAIVPTK